MSCTKNGQLNYETNKENGRTKSYYENGLTYFEDGKVRSKVDKEREVIFYNKNGEQVSYEEMKQEKE
ncbi:hypothetical protein [Myroides pelagicus]|uniref:Toxin-antitoxin system YwqK family antitoxin n=1 Tax=Myroides pelagicus TaxID=270914 RepID=A0A7K1GT77_9FLAO|nr:hypothetical protein [Myroides pelagicus]MEC4114160.1 hypothetical protein [Myroides pelagicus]MTH31103.1 hypothetical protein [Myroides pelagicus]